MDLVVVATPETSSILQLFVPSNAWPSIEDKRLECPLGFDEFTFFENERARTKTRERLGIHREDIVLLVTSRFSPEKWPTICSTFRAFKRVLAQHENLHCIVVGLNDNKLSQQMRLMAQDCRHSQRIHLEPFSDRKASLNFLTGLTSLCSDDRRFPVKKHWAQACEAFLQTTAQ